MVAKALWAALLVPLALASSTTAASVTFSGTQQSTEPVLMTYTDVLSYSLRKFPAEDAATVHGLVAANVSVNQSISYMTDIEQYGEYEVWVEMPASRRGDCEDYALTKRHLLYRMRYPVITHVRVTTLIIDKQGGHAVLEVRLPSGAVAVLDNRFAGLMTREELVRDHGYIFPDW